MWLRVLDLDGGYATARTLHALRETGNELHVVAARDLGPSLRLWGTNRAVAAIGRRVAAASQGDGTAITLIGSGDYHHLTAALISVCERPLTVVHFDNHPDWVRVAPRWHCGAWVLEALRLPHVRRVVTVGVCSDDLVRPRRRGAGLAPLGDQRHVVLPWRHPPSHVRGSRIGTGPGRVRRGDWLHWACLADLPGWERRLPELIETEDVWITIDKDVLPPSEAETDWDQGDMPLETLACAVSIVASTRRVVGGDICGDSSPRRHRNPFKAWEAWRDQAVNRPPSAVGRARNRAADRALLAALRVGAS